MSTPGAALVARLLAEQAPPTSRVSRLVLLQQQGAATGSSDPEAFSQYGFHDLMNTLPISLLSRHGSPVSPLTSPGLFRM